MAEEEASQQNPGPFKVGTILKGRYELQRTLGEGGFAVVYLAFDRVIERPVAIKVLNNEMIRSGGESAKLVRDRFLREVRLTAQIRHPGIVEIYDFGVLEEGQHPYMIMEYLEGTDLDLELGQRGGLDAERVLPLFVGALEALGKAHKQGVIHKDLKPANLFLSDASTEHEAIKVVDFGIAHTDHGSDGRLTKTGAMTGTPHYLPPEYLQSQEVSPPMDVYQMGLILVETLTGRRVVEGDTVFQAILKHVHRDFEIPQGIVESQLGPVVEKAIAFEPGDRYPTATEFGQALSAIDAAALGAELKRAGLATGAKESGPVGTQVAYGGEADHHVNAQTEMMSQPPEMKEPGAAVAGAEASGEADGVGESGEIESAPAWTEEVVAPVTEEALAPKESRKKRGLVVMAVLLLALVVGALVVWMVGGEATDEDPTGVAEVPTEEATPQDDEMAQAPEESDLGEDEEALDDEEESDEDDEPTQVATLESEPSGAEVLNEAGERLGVTPMDVQWEGDGSKSVVLEMEGYAPHEMALEGGAPAEVVALESEVSEPTPQPEPEPEPTPQPTPQPEPEPEPEPEPTPQPEPEPQAAEEEEDSGGWAMPGMDDDEEASEDDDDDDGGYRLAD